MDIVTKTIRSDPELNEAFQRIVGMYKRNASETQDYDIKKIFKVYNEDN
jgi:hypothetical protein